MNLDRQSLRYVGGKFEIGCGMLIRITTLDAVINAKIREGKIKVNNNSPYTL